MGFRANAALALLLLVIGCPSPAQRMKPDPIPQIAGPPVGPVVTYHSVTIGARRIPYRAEFREYELQSNGRPKATISATAYVRTDVRDPSDRPVFFFFNGGPGASSSPLQFEAFGPRIRIRRPASQDQFSENGSSPLDVADLIFVDPVGTGFSRVLPGGSGMPFWTPLGDAESVVYLIRRWLHDNHREHSPLFIAGESYGGFRLATMTRSLADLNVAGLVFISPSLAECACGNTDTNYVTSFPSMAVAAWYHRKVDRKGLSAAQFFDEAARFSESDYLVGLEQGSALPTTERDRLAARMAGFIGLAPEQIAAANLRISDDAFVGSLLKDQNEVIGRLDDRIVATVRPPARQGRPAAANDPSLGLGKTNVISSPGITSYMNRELNVPIHRDYVALSLDVNFSWGNNDREARDDPSIRRPLVSVARLMKLKPALRAMVAGGLFDLTVPILQARYAVRHSSVPLARVQFLTLEAGHSSYDTAATRAQFADALRKFVREQSISR